MQAGNTSDFSKRLEASFPDKKYESRTYFPIEVKTQNLSDQKRNIDSRKMFISEQRRKLSFMYEMTGKQNCYEEYWLIRAVFMYIAQLAVLMYIAQCSANCK